MSMAESTYKQPAFDPLIQTENIAFDSEELLPCGGCGRMNPPNRLKCLYCAYELEIKVEDAAAIKQSLRKPRALERGFNVVALQNLEAKPDTAKIAVYLSMEPVDLHTILDPGVPLPVARVESEKEAAIVQLGLERFGLRSMIVSDADLAADKPPVRLSGIEITCGVLRLKDFNTGTITEIMTDDLALVVPRHDNCQQGRYARKKTPGQDKGARRDANRFGPGDPGHIRPSPWQRFSRASRRI